MFLNDKFVYEYSHGRFNTWEEAREFLEVNGLNFNTLLDPHKFGFNQKIIDSAFPKAKLDAHIGLTLLQEHCYTSWLDTQLNLNNAHCNFYYSVNGEKRLKQLESLIALSSSSDEKKQFFESLKVELIKGNFHISDM